MSESGDKAVVKALRERLAGASDQTTAGFPCRGELLAIGRECAALPDYDPRSAGEILGYDAYGIPR